MTMVNKDEDRVAIEALKAQAARRLGFLRFMWIICATPVVAGLFYTQLMPIIFPSPETKLQRLQSDPEYRRILECSDHPSCMLSATELATLQTYQEEVRSLRIEMYIDG